MSTAIVIAAGVAAAGLGAGALLLWRRGSGGFRPMTERRRFVLDRLAEVVPSQYGDAKFKRIAPGYDPNDSALPKGFTTCGYLPCYIGSMLGAPRCITQGGLEQMRTNGRAIGAWVEPGNGRRPSPGDLFAIGSPQLVTHVGVIVDASGDTWKTADAGQGPMGAGQRADYVIRPYDMATNTLGGPGATLVAGQGWTIRGEPRHLAGWIDIDKVPGAKP